MASEIAKPKIRMNLTNPERLLQSTTLTAQARFGATLREQIDFSSLGVGRLRNQQSLLDQMGLYVHRLTRSQDLTRSFASLTRPERLLQRTTLTAQARFGATLREQIDFSSFGAGRLLREQQSISADRVAAYMRRVAPSHDLTRSFMSLNRPERLLQSTTLTAQARFGATLREQIDFSSLGVGGLLRELRLDRVVGFTPRLGEGNFRVADLLQRMESVERQLLEMDPGLGRLLILLRYVPLGRALAMMELMVSRGREPFLEVLAKVLLDPSRIEVFRTVVSAASLPASVEKDLLHAFEHLEEREVDLAFPPLIGGLEGAMRDAARARGDRKIRRNARSVAAILFDTDYELLIGMIYSEANDGRHGVPFDRRAGCVLALVGLVVWMNDCQQRPAIPWLGQEVGRSLAEHRLVDVQRASLHSG